MVRMAWAGICLVLGYMLSWFWGFAFGWVKISPPLTFDKELMRSVSETTGGEDMAGAPFGLVMLTAGRGWKFGRVHWAEPPEVIGELHERLNSEDCRKNMGVAHVESPEHTSTYSACRHFFKCLDPYFFFCKEPATHDCHHIWLDLCHPRCPPFLTSPLLYQKKRKEKTQNQAEPPKSPRSLKRRSAAGRRRA